MQIISNILLTIGAIFMVIGTLGIWYRKHYMEKLHFLTISDTVGMLLFLLGVIFQFHDIWKTIFMLLLYAILGPMTSHILARAFYLRRD
jgi:multicomponent Na+:H+ antiporter subunit G